MATYTPVPDDLFMEIWNDCEQPAEVMYRLALKGYNVSYASVTSKGRRLKKTHTLRDFRKFRKSRNGQA